MPISESSVCLADALRRHRSGYTLIEVVVAVAILAVAVTVAAPSFVRMVEQQRTQSVLRGVDIALTDLRAQSQLDARTIAAQELERALAQDLPSDWSIAVDEGVAFSPAGACTGGALTVTTPRQAYRFILEHRTCSLGERIA